MVQKVGTRFYRVRHYTGMKEGKPQYIYHQNSQSFAEEEIKKTLSLKGDLLKKEDATAESKETLNNIALEKNSNIALRSNSRIALGENKANLGFIQQSMAWASSSVRIEHQPPKLGVEGSNPSPPATVFALRLLCKSVN
jgi:hypothetical protein